MLLQSRLKDNYRASQDPEWSALGFPNTPNQCISKILNLLEHGRPKLRGQLDAVFRHDECPICRTFTHAVKQIEGTESPHTKFPNGNPIEYSVALGSLLITPDDLVGPKVQNIEVDIEVSTRYLDQRRSFAARENVTTRGYAFRIRKGLKESTFADPAVRVFQRKDEMCDGTIDKTFLLAWLRAWSKVHPAECRLPSSARQAAKVDQLLLIDVDEMCIVSAPTDARYLALSYVWGSSSWLRAGTMNIEELRRSGSLRKLNVQLPSTIQDAIELVRQLGEKYLWVDSLCILQDDKDQKMHQIASMHLIYSEAQLVIVAAHGKDANAGLPGLRSNQYPRRVVRRREVIHDNARLLSILPSDIMLVESTYWNTRAWTMQESRLAKTQLIFTTTQAFLQCQCGAKCSEDRALDLFHNKSDLIMLTPRKGAKVPPTFWVQFCVLVQDFTSRNLSHEQDVMDAFSAIASMLAETWDQPFCFGVPKYLIGPAMMWTPSMITKPFIRRRCDVDIRIAKSIKKCPLPSWSWIGWSGAISCGIIALGNLVKLGCTDCMLELMSETPLQSHMRFSNRDRPPHLLWGTAWTAQFDIGPFEEHKYGIFKPGSSIIGEDGETIGHAVMHFTHDWERQDFIHKSCDVMATCAFLGDRFRRGAKEFVVENDQYGDKTKWLKVVHIVVVHYDEFGIGERVGSGEMLWDDWMAAKPIKKEITLA